MASPHSYEEWEICLCVTSFHTFIVHSIRAHASNATCGLISRPGSSRPLPDSFQYCMSTSHNKSQETKTMCLQSGECDTIMYTTQCVYDIEIHYIKYCSIFYNKCEFTIIYCDLARSLRCQRTCHEISTFGAEPEGFLWYARGSQTLWGVL